MKLNFARAGLLLLMFLFCASCATKAVPPKTFSGVTPLEWSVRLAHSEMARQTNAPKWDYTMGLFTLSLLKLNNQVPDARFVNFTEE